MLRIQREAQFEIQLNFVPAFDAITISKPSEDGGLLVESRVVPDCSAETCSASLAESSLSSFSSVSGEGLTKALSLGGSLSAVVVSASGSSGSGCVTIGSLGPNTPR